LKNNNKQLLSVLDMNDKQEYKGWEGAYYYNPGSESYFNMAFDNWLFDEIQTNARFPRVILRLYTWEKPSITLGYNQNIDRAIDFTRLNKSVPVIRRITGGRAIYHDESEITFSLIADLKIFSEKDRSLSKTNQLISRVVVQILESVGIVSEWTRNSDTSFGSSAGAEAKSCFNSYSRYEIFSPKGKIVAGAQRRKADYFIHQGSLKINGISECLAIGQSDEADSVPKSKDSDNSYDYTIDQFRVLFPDKFSENLKTNLTEWLVDKELHREICLLAKKLI